MQGAVTLRGGDGVISLKSVEGAVTLQDATGRIEVNGVNRGITLRNVSGDIAAETVNGSILLDGIESSDVEAVTVKIVKLALSEADEKIGITLHRDRR